MGTHVIEAARAAGVDKTVLLGTVCSYPKLTPVPFEEASFWDGYPEETNAPYGIAKKAHLVHAQVNAAQYGQRFAYLVPDQPLRAGRQVPPVRVARDPRPRSSSASRRSRRAVTRASVGNGTASREYLYVDDAAAAIVRAAEYYDEAIPEVINLGANHEITIRQTVETIAGLVGFGGELRWDPSKPDGQPRRRVDASRASELLGWKATTPFEDGLRATIDWYLANRAEAERVPGS